MTRTRTTVLLAIVLLLIFGSGEVVFYDGTSMLGVSRSLVHHGIFSVPASLGVRGRHGLYFSKYGIGNSLLAVPAVGLADVLSPVVGHQQILESFFAACIMPVVVGLLLLAVVRLGRALGASQTSAVAVAVMVVFGTFVLPYSKDLFSEPVETLFIVVGAERLLRERFVTAGIAFGAAVLERPQAAALLVLVPFAFDSLRTFDVARVRALVRVGAGALPFVVAAGAYDLYRFGAVTKTGYQYEPGFTTPFLTGARGLLVNPSKSVIVFAPLLLVLPWAVRHVWRSDPGIVRFFGLNFVVTFVFAATWWSWEGGWSWGPRLLLSAVVPLLALLGPWLDVSVRGRRVATGLAVVGFLITIATLVVPVQAQQLDTPESATGPAIVRQIELVPTSLTHAGSAFGDTAVRTEATPDVYRRFPSLWQVDVLRELGRAAFLGAVLFTLFVLAGVVVVARRLRPWASLLLWLEIGDAGRGSAPAG